MHLTDSVISVQGAADSFLESFVSLDDSAFYMQHPKYPLTYHRNVLFCSTEDNHCSTG